MKKISTFACFAVLLAVPFAAKAQDNLKVNYSFQFHDQTVHATLDDLAESMLDDPYVLSEIKVTKSQWTRLQARQVTTGLLAMVIAGLAGDDSITDDDKAALAAVTKEISPSSTMTLDFPSLTASQKAQAHRIAIRDRTAEALLTKEVVFALHITPAQQKRLETVRNEYWARCGKIEGKNANWPDLTKKFKSFAPENPDDQTPVQRVRSAKKLFDFMVTMSANVAAKIEAPIDRATKDANARARRVLTSAQTAQLRRLQA